MSNVVKCPTCNGPAKLREKEGEKTYKAVTDEEKGRKISQLKKAMIKFREKAKELEKELEALKTN